MKFAEIQTYFSTSISFFAVLIPILFFLINLSITSFKLKIKIGYNDTWSKYDLFFVLPIYITGFFIGFLFSNYLFSHLPTSYQSYIIAGIILVLFVSISVLYYKFENKSYMLRTIGNLKINRKVSATIIILTLNILGFISELPFYILFNNKQIYIALGLTAILFFYGVNFIGSFYNIICLKDYPESIVILNDDKKLFGYILGIDNSFLIIKVDNKVQYINISLISKFYECPEKEN